MPMVKRVGNIVAFGAALIVLSGCVISGSNRSYSCGTRVSHNLLAGFEPGSTTHGEIERSLGAPTRSFERADGSVVLVYEHTRVRDEEAGLLFVFHSETYRKTTTTTFIEVIDGVYERAWVETT